MAYGIDASIYTNPYNCNQFRWIWVWWKGGAIYVGEGRVVGCNTFLYFNDSSPVAFNSLALRSLLSNVVVNWIVPYNITSPALTSESVVGTICRSQYNLFGSILLLIFLLFFSSKNMHTIFAKLNIFRIQ